jgi:DNA-binding response OmpR family regulator
MEPQRKTQPTDIAPKAVGSGSDLDPASQLRVRVVAVTPRASVRRRLSSMLHGQIESLSFVDDANSAIEEVSTSNCDLVIIERALKDTDGIDLLNQLSANHPAIVGVIIGQVENTDDAVRAMRSGACDLISIQSKSAETTSRLLETVQRAQRIRQRDARVDRLKKLCHKLNTARQEVSGQVGDLCTDLVDAYRDLSEQFGDVKIATELNSLLRQELDIESLLRTMLEFTLSRIGSTNAVVFLPTSSGDYSLGAYVNYDIPRDAAEIMLDQLADTLAPRFEGVSDVITICGSLEMDEAFGNESHWLEDSAAMVVSCDQEEESLAVVALFRDESKPFSDEDARTLGIISKLFGEQLNRVIRVHHRHLPKDQWGAIDTGPGDDYDFEGDYSNDPDKDLRDDDDDFFSSDDNFGFAA